MTATVCRFGVVVAGGSCRRRLAHGAPGRAGPVRPASPAARAARSGAAPCCRAPSRPGVAPAGAGRTRAVLMGRTRSGSAPASASTARTKPHQVVAPLLVAWKRPGRRSRPSVTTAGARSAVNVGDPCWSSTKRSSPSPSARRSAVRDHVGAVGPAQPARADDGRARPALALTGQLGGAVDRGRVRGVPLPVGPVGRAVEDVVGRHVHDVRAHQRGRLGDVAGADGVDGVGRVDLGLAAFDRSERATVQDELGTERG